MRIHCFQHVSFENPGSIVEWAQQHHHSITYTCFYKKDFSFALLSDMDLLLIMGGPMNVDEEAKYPWLHQEKQFIKKAIEEGKKVLGICLGSQLIAASLGSKVYPATQKEIGFFPIQFTSTALEHPLLNHFQNPCTIFHWHGDTFDLPKNAQLLASTTSCQNQAFLLHEQVLGLQCHLEMNENLLEEMLTQGEQELQEKGDYIQSSATIKENHSHLQQNKKELFLLLDKFIMKGVSMQDC